MEEADKFCQEIDVEAVTRIMSMEDIHEVVKAENAQATRVRKLSMLVTVLVIVCMNLYTRISLPYTIKVSKVGVENGRQTG
jgi:hypothetical protein